MKLDFSEFHPTGDHWPYGRYCRGLPGGGRRHLRLAWDFHRREQVIGWWRRPLFCTWGRHRWQVWQRNDGAVRVLCIFCPATRLPSEADLDIVASWPKMPFGGPEETS